MSTEEAQIFSRKITVAGAEWWYHAAILAAFLIRPESEGFKEGYTIDSNEHGATLTIETHSEPIEEMDEDLGMPVKTTYLDVIGDFTLTTTDRGMTIITGQCEPEARERWIRALNQVQDIAAEARDIHRAIAPTPDQVIERYYRARAAGAKVTLKQAATQSGISYSWLRQRKMEYDRAGKWGSKQTE